MLVNIQVENDLINEATGLLGCLSARDNNGCGMCDDSQDQARKVIKLLCDTKRIPVNIYAYKEKQYEELKKEERKTASRFLNALLHIADQEKLIEAYREKRKYDGGEGRVWSASRHLDADNLIAELELKFA